jgi:hypothetical protein
LKTAISIDDGLLQEADDAARRLGVSRSRLFALAVRDFLERQRRGQVLTQLDRASADHPDPLEKRVLKGMKAKMHRTVNERW